MRPEERDLAYIWDMREAARQVLAFTAGKAESDLVTDLMLRMAVARALIVVGEAARRVSQQFKDANSEIPWGGIVGQRNILVHQYEDVASERIWLVVSRDLPGLVSALDLLLPDEPER
jgi:uncharacterized protein with HEPN domain